MCASRYFLERKLLIERRKTEPCRTVLFIGKESKVDPLVFTEIEIRDRTELGRKAK